MKKKIFSLILASVMLFALCAAPVSAANKVGDPLGDVLYTDIVAYIDGHPIQSFNIGGNTYIVAEPLLLYGFGVAWIQETRQVVISRTRTASPENYTSDFVPTASQGKPGEVAMKYVYTDVVTLIGDKQIESYNIGGLTCISIDTLAAEFGYTLVWDGDARTISMFTTAGGSADTGASENTGFDAGSLSSDTQIMILTAAEKFVSEYLSIGSDFSGELAAELGSLAGEIPADKLASIGMIIESLYADYSYEILESSFTDYGIGVKVRITMRDLSTVVTDTFMTLAGVAMSNPEITEEQLTELAMTTMIKEIADETREIAAREATVNIALSEDGTVSFFEEDNYELLNALLGGLYEDPMLSALLG